MAAYAALVSLLNNINTIANHPRLSTSLNNKHIQPLLEKTGFLLDFIEGNTHGGGSKEVQDLERRIASAAHAAEDLIESHIVDRIHEAKRSYLLKFLLKFVSCHVIHRVKVSLRLKRIIEDMHAIMKDTDEFKEKHRLGEEQQPARQAEPFMLSGESAMVGLDAELIQLLDELTNDQPNRRIISIVGMGGTGKTTLAKNVYEHSLIKERFDIRAWATISQQNNAKEILSKLLSCVGELISGAVNDIGLKLRQTLWGRRYLIVLDDIWNVEAWDEVKQFFPDNENGSGIILTTRLLNVAEGCDSSLFNMNLLDQENSWKLFHEKAFQNENCPPELHRLAENIVKLCKGLALSIVVIGGLLLKSPRTLEYWKKVENDLKSIPYSKEKQEILDVLSLSYNHLPPHLKPCFLYMGIFKEDSEIRISKIINLWIAEGFIKPTGSQLLEENAEGFIKDMIDRNLILVGRHHKSGKVGSCGIHDLLRDLSIKLAKQEEFFHNCKDRICGIERCLINDWDMEWEGLRLPFERSIMTYEYIKEPTKFRLLRVLVEVSSDSPIDYYRNVNLRYLDYELPYNVEYPLQLPTSISLIWNLQTLIINPSFGYLIVASNEFWKLGQLRHVKCVQIYLPDPPPSYKGSGLLMLEKLQTLKGIVNLRLCEEVCEVIPNIKKLRLIYDRDLPGHDIVSIESLCNLDRLQKLESLKLVTRNSWDWFLDREPKRRLTTSLPKSLKNLCLVKCEFYWDDMTIIGSLPQLEVLQLELNSASSGDQWSPVDGQFRRLKFLKIAYCRLVCWDADESHFPVLEKLILIGLNRLEEIPLDIGDIPTLQLIHVSYCNNSTAISSVRIKENQLQQNDGLHVQVTMREKQWESFNQMLETERLTTNNIHLEILQGRRRRWY